MQEKLSSFITDVSDLFLAPKKLAERIDERPRFVAPIAFLAIIAIIQSFSVQEIVMKSILENSQFPSNVEASPFIQAGIVAGVLFAPFGVILNAAIEAVKLFLFGKIFKGVAKFESVFSMTLYTTIISECGAIINSLLVNLSGNIYANISPAYFLPKGTNQIIYTLVSLLNPFIIAIFIVDIIMIQVIHRYSKKSAIATVVLTFGFNILFTLAMVWLSTLIAPMNYTNPYNKF